MHNQRVYYTIIVLAVIALIFWIIKFVGHHYETSPLWGMGSAIALIIFGILKLKEKK